MKMSRKNHKMVEGRLLQMDKKFSSLKEKQKTKIAEWFYEAYRKYYMESGNIPDKRDNEKILEYVFIKSTRQGYGLRTEKYMLITMVGREDCRNVWKKRLQKICRKRNR